MAYDRTTGVEGNPDRITFYYAVDKIFNSLSLRTTYRANNIKSQAGEAMLDEYAISQSEKDIVKELTEEAIYEIFGEMYKITEGINHLDLIFTNSEYYMFGEEDPIFASGGSILDYASFDQNLLSNIDQKIENAIRYFILSRWYIICSLGDDAKLNAEQYREYLRKVKNLTFQLRKPLMS